MRDSATGICSECKSTPEAYHRRNCSQFKGYLCHRCDGVYQGEYCPNCPAPWWVDAVGAQEEKP